MNKKTRQAARAKLKAAKKAFTRRKAEKAIAAATSLEELSSDRFSKHANKHVRAKAAYKAGRL